MLQYTVDWTTQHEPHWREWLGHLRGQNRIRMAEIGCYEGRSSRWFAENVTALPDSMLHCYDNWSARTEELWRHNTHGMFPKVSYGGPSSIDLLGRGLYDAIYIDADHKPSCVLLDACNAWQALKPGGTLIFDDYRLVDPARAVNVKLAVDAFCTVMGLEMYHSPWPLPQYPDYWGQVMVRKSL